MLQGLYYIPCTLKIWNIHFLFYSKFIGEYSHNNHTWNQDNENLNLVLWTPVLLCAHICYNSSIIAIRHTNVLRRYNFSDNFPCWEWFLLKKPPPMKNDSNMNIEKLMKKKIISFHYPLWIFHKGTVIVTPIKCIHPYRSLKFCRRHQFFSTFCIGNSFCNHGPQRYSHDNFINQ